MSSSSDSEMSAEDQLLLVSRQGNAAMVSQLLEARKAHTIHLDINCKGHAKSNSGWTPLLLASYFGHKDVVQLLIEHGADVDLTNDVGETALHRAAYTGRVEVVMMLLASQADVTIINTEGLTAKHVTKDQDIRDLIDAAEQYECLKLENDFHTAVREGDVTAVQQMLSRRNRPQINCVDKFGNTVLHNAACRGRNEMAVMLLQHGINSTITNDKGQTAFDMCRSQSMKQLLDVKPLQMLRREVQRFDGPLLKKSRLQRLKCVWVVLQRGVLNYYKSRADATTGANRKGFKYLDDAKVKPHEGDSHSFTVYYSDDTQHSYMVDPSETARITRQKWLNSLSEHISFSTYYTRKGSVNADEELDDLLPQGSLHDALQTSQAHQQLLEKQVASLTATVNNITDDKQLKTGHVTSVRQRLSGIVESSREMCTSLAHCLTLFTQQEELRKVELHQAMEKSRVLQDALHVLALEHHELEQSVTEKRAPSRYDTDDDEFYDCDDDEEEKNAVFTASAAGKSEEVKLRTESFVSLRSATSDTDKEFELAEEGGSSSSNIPSVSVVAAPDMASQDDASTAHTSDILLHRKANFFIGNGCVDSDNPTVIIGNRRLSTWDCRSCLPVEMFSRNDFSVWSILKQCIGRELSKITMPVIFNEPLSFLQRVTEYMEYSSLLQYASESDDPIQRLEYVSAFAVSGSASNWDRVGKPFNPLLGETYELNREDLGFRIVCEQVSHHPPVSAFHVESPHYKFHGSVHPKLKFWGKTVECFPKGVLTLELTQHNEVYTWSNINCSIHNIIVGKLWIEHHGVLEIQSHTNGLKSVLNFKQGGWFGRDLHKIEGFIFDRYKNKVRAMYGKWVESLVACSVEGYENASGGTSKHITIPKFKLSRASSNPSNHNGSGEFADCSDNVSRLSLQEQDDDDVPSIGSIFDLEIAGQVLLWHADPRPQTSSKYYSFTLYAMMLNELTSDLTQQMPSTDSRLRPDIRKLEDGNLDVAAEEKVRLEEKQRAARKERKRLKEEWQPRWFQLTKHPQTGKEDWQFTGTYWDRNFSNLPDIF